MWLTGAPGLPICIRRRALAPSQHAADATRLTARGQAAGSGASQASTPRRGCRRCARSLEDLRRAVASLEPHFVGARRPARTIVEVDEEVLVDLHAALRTAVHP